jgi:hypothetical protein
MRLRSALVAMTALAAPLLVAAPARAACVSTTTTLTGRIGGEDGRFVDAQLGFDIKDKYGNHLDGHPGSSAYGCGGYHGYGISIRVNRTVGPTGSTTTGTKDWSVTLPGNTAFVHIEVYPRAAEDGPVDETRYGHAYRRSVPVPYGQAVNIRLPLVCAAGGSVGGINGWVTKNGVRTKADFVGAWSLAKDNNSFSPIMGWNVGTSYANGYAVVGNLKTGQLYTIQIHKDGVIKQKYNVAIKPCQNVYVGASF